MLLLFTIVVHERDLILDLIVYRVEGLCLHPQSGVELHGENASGLVVVLLQDIAEYVLGDEFGLT